jgi:hypothetical protein
LENAMDLENDEGLENDAEAMEVDAVGLENAEGLEEEDEVLEVDEPSRSPTPERRHKRHRHRRG